MYAATVWPIAAKYSKYLPWELYLGEKCRIIPYRKKEVGHD
jgi:hypothetical protein